ncbi:MFS transporter [Paenibacillus psychroresistens]|uniref:MFS transporter n=1 Tax=Paenibacillus psychroresistens TaxID=1778678 RepID=A0A6B8RHS6_9BACL|nr:MFS transporter [Paenibacillus psychroresistens]QGQ95437.1 MFS transporter [Paenibacillus psychroresistens]
MDNKKVRAWIYYDWANSAFATTMMAAVLPIFYVDTAALTLGDSNLALSYWGFTQTIAMLIAALIAPILGAYADYSGTKMRFLRVFSLMGILASGLFALIGEGDYILASVLFIIGSIGYSSSSAFYDALLPDLVPPEKRDMISSKGFAFGYIGGGLLLIVNLVMIQTPQVFGFPNKLVGVHVAFITVAVWWFVFSLPLFRRVKDIPLNTGKKVKEYTAIAFARTWGTLKHISRYPELFKFIVAFWFFNDGINTIITMATTYGKTIGIETSDLITALIITQFVGIPFTLIFGKIAERLGSKRSLYISLFVYMLIVILGYFMTSALHFYILAFMVGLVQGGSQAIARSIFSQMVPKGRSSEFFGFLNVSSRFSSILGPFVFSMVSLLTGSARFGILSLFLFFAVGILLLMKVNLEKGAKEAI